jgi:hypothetical protein
MAHTRCHREGIASQKEAALRTCSVAGRPRGQGALRQQIRLSVETAAGPEVEFALARAMLIFLDEVRSEGMVVYHVGLELNGESGRAGRQLERPGLDGAGLGGEP